MKTNQTSAVVYGEKERTALVKFESLIIILGIIMNHMVYNIPFEPTKKRPARNYKHSRTGVKNQPIKILL